MSTSRRRDANGRLLAVVILAAGIGVVGGGLGAWAVYARFGPVQQFVTSPTQGGNGSTGSLAGVAAAVQPSLVTVVTQPVTPAGLLGGSSGFANGFVVSADGLVVTSAHAIQGATRLRIGTFDGHGYDAIVVATDLVHGLVVLRAAGATGLTPLSFAGAAPAAGDLAIAVSRPPLATVSLGVGTVSATGRAVEIDRSTATSVLDAMTIDAAPEPEADGAPVLDGSRHVIGVVVTITAATPPPGLTALSGRAAADLAARAGSGVQGSAASFGADSAFLDPATASAAGLASGALIRSVDPNGPAALAGLGPGDIVTAVNGTTIDADHPFDAVALKLSPGQQVTINVVIAGTARTVTLTVGGGP